GAGAGTRADGVGAARGLRRRPPPGTPSADGTRVTTRRRGPPLPDAALVRDAWPGNAHLLGVPLPGVPLPGAPLPGVPTSAAASGTASVVVGRLLAWVDPVAAQPLPGRRHLVDGTCDRVARPRRRAGRARV